MNFYWDQEKSKLFKVLSKILLGQCSNPRTGNRRYTYQDRIVETAYVDIIVWEKASQIKEEKIIKFLELKMTLPKILRYNVKQKLIVFYMPLKTIEIWK